MYKIINNREGNLACLQVEKPGVTLSIPPDPENTDYQEYLKLLEEGNTPLPADDPS